MVFSNRVNCIKSLKIGSLKLKNNLFLSPMVDVTDMAFRMVCREEGAGMAYSEMIYASALLYEEESEKLKRILKTNNSDKPLGLQITANNVREMEEILPYLHKNVGKNKRYNLIDLNCGCPSVRIVGNEAGSFLLNSPEKIASFVRLLKSEGFIVTVKMRLGFKKNEGAKIAMVVEGAGADALCVHARTAIQKNSIPSDWEEIAKIKSAVKIPVIGNGDIFSPEDAERIFLETKCDGIMIARGAISSPSIFFRIKTGKVRDYKKDLKLFLKYIGIAEKEKILDMSRVKYIGSRVIRGFSGAVKLREKLMRAKNSEEVRKICGDYL